MGEASFGRRINSPEHLEAVRIILWRSHFRPANKFADTAQGRFSSKFSTLHYEFSTPVSIFAAPKTEPKYIIMAGKKFTKKKLRLRGRVARRRHALKVAPITKGFKQTIEMGNLEVIRSLEAKVAAAQA